MSTATAVTMLDVRAGSGAITLPLTTQIPYRVITIKDAYGAAGLSSIVINTQGNDVFENGASSITLTNAYDTTTLYAGQSGYWYTIGGSRLAATSFNTLSTGLITSPLRLGTLSTQTAIQFPGLRQGYTGTVIAEQGTGAGTQELLLYKASSISDQIRLQTTGSIVFETGAAARSFPSTTQLATPTLIIQGSTSNVGIGTAAPAATLDVAGTGRFQTLSSLTLNVSSINGAAPGGASFTGSTLALSTGLVYASNVMMSGPLNMNTNVISNAGTITESTYVSNMVLWFDGNDSTTLFQDGGGATPVTADNQSVYLWKDKSVYATNATPVTTSYSAVPKSTYGTQNSKNGIYFGGTSGFQFSSANMPGGAASNATYFFVAKQSSSSPPGQSFAAPTATILFTTGDQSQSAALRTTQNNSGMQVYIDGISPSGGSNWNSSVPYIQTLVVQSGQLIRRANGLQLDSTAFTGAVAANTGTGRISETFGSFYNYWNGQVYEVLVYNTYLLTTAMQQIEGYLAWKWGITLNAAHPYYAASPGITPSPSGTLTQFGSFGLDTANNIQITATNAIRLTSAVQIPTTLTTSSFTVSSINGAAPWQPSFLTSTVQGLNSNISSMIDPTELTSSIVGLGTVGFISAVGLTYVVASTAQGLGTFGYTSTNQLLSTTIGIYGAIGSNIATTVQPQFVSTVQGLGSAGYISTSQLTSTVRGMVFSGSTTTLSSAVINVSSLSSAFINATQGYISSLVVDSLAIGSNSGFINMGDIITTSISSLQINTGLLTASGAVCTSQLVVSTINGLAVPTQFTGSTNFLSASLVQAPTLSTLALNVSTINGSTVPQLIGAPVQSTVIGLGTVGYVSTASLVSTFNAITYAISQNTVNTIFYLNPGIPAPTYRQMSPNQTTLPQSTMTTFITRSTSNIPIAQFQTDFNIPQVIPLGAFDLNLFAYTDHARTYTYASLFSRAGTTETLLASSSNATTNIGTSPDQQYTNTLFVPQTIFTSTTGVSLVLKVFANNPNNQDDNLYTYYQGGDYSHVHTSFGTVIPDTLFTSTVAGLGSAGYISTIIPFNGSTTTLSSAVINVSSISACNISSVQGYVSSLRTDSLTVGGPTGYVTVQDLRSVTVSTGQLVAGQGFISSLQINSLSFGPTGYVIVGNFIASSLSTMKLNTQNLYTNNAYIGNVSSQSAILFPGVDGNYRGTAVAEQTTGAGTGELLLYKTSTTTDQIRLQTTGNIVFEAGASVRSWPSTQTLATPTLYIQGTTSNVGIGTATPGATLDVVGFVRAQTISSLALNISSINGAAPGGTFSGSTTTLSSAVINVSSLSSSYIKATQGYISSLTVDYLAIGSNLGFMNMGDIITTSHSSLQINTGLFTATGAVCTPQLVVSSINGLAVPTQFTGSTNFLSASLVQAPLFSTFALNVSSINGAAPGGTFTGSTNFLSASLIQAPLLSTFALNVSSINGAAPGGASFTGSTTTLSSGSVYASNIVVKNNGNVNSNTYGVGIDTLTLQTTAGALAGGIASLYFGASNATYPLARIGAIDYGITYGNSALVFQTATPANASLSGVITYSYSNANQTFTVPSGITSVTVYMWGAGGGGGAGTGGAGAFIQGTLAVTPGNTLTVIVGGGGLQNGAGTFGGGGSSGGNSSASGGGRSAIQLSGTELVDVGGGGGGSYSGYQGGAANYSPTINGGAAYRGGQATYGGYGGTQTAGGAVVTGPVATGTVGTYLQGGTGGNFGGGGGGGFYGGGGGSTASSDGCAGGGGSSYTTNAAFTLITGSNSPNTAAQAPATASPYYVSGVAAGATGGNTGGSGLVVIVYNPPYNLSETMRISQTGSIGIGTSTPQTLLHVSGMTYSIAISTQALTVSSINGQTFGQPIQSTVVGLGTVGYLSSLTNVSLLSTLNINVSSINGLAVPTAFTGSTLSLSTASIFTSSLQASTISVGGGAWMSNDGLYLSNVQAGGAVGKLITNAGYVKLVTATAWNGGYGAFAITGGDLTPKIYMNAGQVATGAQMAIGGFNPSPGAGISLDVFGTGRFSSISTFQAVTSSIGVGTATPQALLDVAGTGRFQFISTLSLQTSSINGAAPWQQSYLTSTTEGLGTLGYISTTQLVSTVTNLITRIGAGGGGTTFVGSTTFLSVAQVLFSTQTGYNISSVLGYVSSLQVDELQIGTGFGIIALGDTNMSSISTLGIAAGLGNFQTINVSSINGLLPGTGSGTSFTGNLGTVSSITALRFYGLTGTYANTALAEVSTGTGTQELLLYKVSSISDQVRVQTTGNVIFEAGVGARGWPTAPRLATPTFYIAGSNSNVGVGTSNPLTTLDVVGTGRFQTLSSLNITAGSINYSIAFV